MWYNLDQPVLHAPPLNMGLAVVASHAVQSHHLWAAAASKGKDGHNGDRRQRRSLVSVWMQRGIFHGRRQLQ